MRKILVLLIGTFMLMGCGSKNYTAETLITLNGINEIRYDGCQYIVFGERMAHKGNCNNPIHVYNEK